MLVRSVDRTVDAMALIVAVSLKCQEQALPLAGFRPPVEAVEHCLPWPEIRWKIRQGTPVRRHHNTASTNLRSSCAGLPAPRSDRKNRTIFDHCLSDS